jgi:CRP-like cAMP-binding protein
MASCYRFLDSLDTDLRQHLLQDHRLLAIPAKHQLFFDSDYGQDVYLVESGILKARKLNLQGDEVVIALMGPGALIVDLAMLSPKPLRTADVLSLTPTTLLKLRHGVVGEAFRFRPRQSRGRPSHALLGQHLGREVV